MCCLISPPLRLLHSLRSARRACLSGSLLVLHASALLAAGYPSSTGQSPQAAEPLPAAFSTFVEKQGAGVLASGVGMSQIPSALKTGEQYTLGGITWEPTTVSVDTPTTYGGSPITIDSESQAVVSITNAPRTADTNAFSTGILLRGTHAETEGDLWVLNRETLTVQPFDPGDETTWSVTVNDLVEGRNRIGIFGQDADGAVAGDGVMIWVGERYTSVPEIRIDAPAFRTVSNGVTMATLTGTHNRHVRGDTWWYNAKTWGRGLIETGIVDAAEWSATVAPLDVGRNPIYVMASNRYGDVTLDLATVIRTERLGAARVVITNWPEAIVSQGNGSAQLSGTHSNLVGSLRWQVREDGTTGFFAPGQAGLWQTAVPVSPGTNTIVIRGRDATGEEDSDEVTVLVGGLRYVTPARLGITNPQPTILPFTRTALEIGVTTVVDQVESLIWTNSDDEVWGYMDLNEDKDGFVATVSDLPVGPTYIDIRLVNTYGNRASELLPIIRQPRPDLPAIEILNAPAVVPYSMTEVNIGGTNNPFVAGPVAWSNTANGIQGTISPQGLTWQGVVQPLAVGENVIVCWAVNESGDRSHDLASIERLGSPSRPLVVITGDVPDRVSYDVKTINLEGTNTPAVSGPMQWVNEAMFLTGEVSRTSETTWSCVVEDLQPGMNVVFVRGSSEEGDSDAAVASIDRDRNRGEARLWINTNGVPPEVDFETASIPLSGTNNEFVVGGMWWVNEAFGVTGDLSRTAFTWAADAVPLPPGVNVIYVYGANELGQVGSDVITIERLPPGGDPVVDATTVPPDRLAYGIDSFQIDGTNSPDVVGLLRWTNEASGVTGTLPVPPDGHWSFEVPGLQPGINNVVVRGTDTYGQDANDIVSVFRDFPPRTRYVAVDGSGQPPYTNWLTAARSIQQAVDAASEGELVLVRAGDYDAGSRVTPGEQTQTRLVVDRGVRVHSVGGPEETLIRGSWDEGLNAVRGARVDPGGELVGFTIREGRAGKYLPGETGNGGGVIVSGGTVSNCWILDNVAAGQGGGIAVEDGGLVADSVLRKNTADMGGGAALSTARLVNSLVVSNKAVHGGGVVADQALIERCRLLDNLAGPASGARGGGLLAQPDTSAVNCVLAGNTADQGAGAFISSNSILAFCTIVGNESGIAGGGVYAIEEAVVLRSILFGNLSATGQEKEFGGPGLSVAESLLPFAHPANAEGSPLLADPARHDYHLMPGSPGIDLMADYQGLALMDDGGLSQDMDGVPRPLDGDADGQPVPDAGAFEFLNPLADSDFDSLPDGWEWDNGLSPVSGAGDDGAGGDPDADELDNEGEYGADTDPFNAGSVLAIRAVDPAGSNVVVTAQGGISATRMLEASETLGDTGLVWSVVDTTPSPNTVTNILTHSGAADRKLFYRVRAVRD